MPKPSAATSARARSSSISAVERGEQRLLGALGVGRSTPRVDAPVARRRPPPSDLRPADVDADDRASRARCAAWLPYAAGCAPGEEKPYRVYRGGRVKGRVPTPARPKPRAAARRGATAATVASAAARAGRARRGGSAGGADRHRDRARDPLLRRLGAARLPRLPQRRLGGEQAARRRRRAARSRPTRARCSRTRPTILLLGTDHRSRPRAGDRALRLDHAPPHRPGPPPALLPLDPARPARRDPGYGDDKINAAFQVGGPRARDPDGRAAHRHRRSTTSSSSTSPSSSELIDKLGGIDVDVPRADPLQVRLPVPDAGALRALARAGASRRASSTWTAAAR